MSTCDRVRAPSLRARCKRARALTCWLRSYWHIKVNALSDSENWDMLRTFSNERKSPITYKAGRCAARAQSLTSPPSLERAAVRRGMHSAWKQRASSAVHQARGQLRGEIRTVHVHWVSVTRLCCCPLPAADPSVPGSPQASHRGCTDCAATKGQGNAAADSGGRGRPAAARPCGAPAGRPVVYSAAMPCVNVHFVCRVIACVHMPDGRVLTWGRSGMSVHRQQESAAPTCCPQSNHSTQCSDKRRRR